MWTPAGFSCHRTLLVLRARQERKDSVALCCCFWKEGRLGKRQGKLYCPLRGEAGTHSAFTPCLETLLFRTFNFDSKVEQKY